MGKGTPSSYGVLQFLLPQVLPSPLLFLFLRNVSPRVISRVVIRSIIILLWVLLLMLEISGFLLLSLVLVIMRVVISLVIVIVSPTSLLASISSIRRSLVTSSISERWPIIFLPWLTIWLLVGVWCWGRYSILVRTRCLLVHWRRISLMWADHWGWDWHAHWRWSKVGDLSWIMIRLRWIRLLLRIALLLRKLATHFWN